MVDLLASARPCLGDGKSILVSEPRLDKWHCFRQKCRHRNLIIYLPSLSLSLSLYLSIFLFIYLSSSQYFSLQNHYFYHFLSLTLSVCLSLSVSLHLSISHSKITTSIIFSLSPFLFVFLCIWLSSSQYFLLSVPLSRVPLPNRKTYIYLIEKNTFT